VATNLLLAALMFFLALRAISPAPSNDEVCQRLMTTPGVGGGSKEGG
jgi:hypothetical protein